MTGLEIAALVAMIAGTGLQYKANTDAQKRRTQETLASMARQDDLNRKAEKTAIDASQEYQSDKRTVAQDQIAEQLTEGYIAPVKSANEINASQTTTQGAVSNDYTTAKAKSEVELMKNAEALARLFGKVGSANNLRQNEAIRMGDTAATVGKFGNFAQGQAGADRIAIDNAGTPSAGMQLAGGLLSAAGAYGLASGAGAAAKGATAAPNMPLGSGMTAPINTGIGQGTAGLGTGMWGMKSGSYTLPKSFAW